MIDLDAFQYLLELEKYIYAIIYIYIYDGKVLIKNYLIYKIIFFFMKPINIGNDICIVILKMMSYFDQNENQVLVNNSKHNDY
jgi:hypothetical protein